MKKLPPINTPVKIIGAVVPTDPRVGQQGTVISYSGHGMVCIHFPDQAEGIGTYFNPQHVQTLEEG